MKVLLINGGPHKDGCTNRALEEIKKTLKDEGIVADIFWTGNNMNAGCIACGYCAKNKKCVFDDSVNKFIQIAPEYDGYIFGTPIHWGGATGTITSFMDRAFRVDGLANYGKTFYMKPGAVVLSARRAGTTAAWDQLNKYMGIMEMPIVTSQYWNMVHGATKEEVEQDLEGLQTMRTLAKNMAFLLKCKETALKYGVEMPKAELRTYTNFIR